MQIYADEMGSVAVTGAIVRIELVVQSVGEQRPDSKPTFVAQQQLIMPIDGFLRAVMRMQGVVQDFEKKGLIKKVPKSEGTNTLTGRVHKAKEPDE